MAKQNKNCTKTKQKKPKEILDIKLNKEQNIKTKKNRKLKEKCKVPIYRIPKNKLDNALKILNSEFEENFPDYQGGCQEYLHKKGNHDALGSKRPDLGRLLNEARTCLINRDWKNLATILSLAKPITTPQQMFYLPILIKYATICLIYNPELDLMKSFLRGVVSSQTETEDRKYLCSLKTLLHGTSENSFEKFTL